MGLQIDLLAGREISINLMVPVVLHVQVTLWPIPTMFVNLVIPAAQHVAILVLKTALHAIREIS